MEIKDKLRSVDPCQLALAKHLPWNGKEDRKGYGPFAVVAYTNSELWQHWTVSICWPERTKSSVSETLDKLGFCLS